MLEENHFQKKFLNKNVHPISTQNLTSKITKAKIIRTFTDINVNESVIFLIKLYQDIFGYHTTGSNRNSKIFSLCQAFANNREK